MEPKEAYSWQSRKLRKMLDALPKDDPDKAPALSYLRATNQILKEYFINKEHANHII